MFKKGEIYLANLNPKKGNEVGKIRPVLIIQTNMLNDIGHYTTIILPLTTKLIDNTYPLRYRISKREKLKKDSDIILDQIKAIDNNRIIPDLIAKLEDFEMIQINNQLKLILDL